MKCFFAKKYIFAAVFLTGWLLFSAFNFTAGAQAWQELFVDFTHIRSISDLEDWISDVEEDMNETMLARENFIDVYGYVQKLFGKREFNNFSVIRDDEGMLYYGSTWPEGVEEFSTHADRVERLDTYVRSKGAKLLVVFPPSKVLTGVSKVNREWPLNDPNFRMDKILDLLRQRKIETVDLRVKMRETGCQLDALFFRTDHHWTPLAAFYAAQEIVAQVEQRFGDDWDPTDVYTSLDSYNLYTYEKCMLGSNGRNVGAVYSGTENYTMLWPKFPADFVWEDYEHELKREGDFTQSLMDATQLEITDLYESSINQLYLHEIVSHDKIVNLENPQGPRLKVLRDSYFSPTACFLAPMCSEIEMMWTRASEEDFDINAFIQDGEYDYFILEIYPYNLDEESFSFFEEPEE